MPFLRPRATPASDSLPSTVIVSSGFTSSFEPAYATELGMRPPRRRASRSSTMNSASTK